MKEIKQKEKQKKEQNLKVAQKELEKIRYGIHVMEEHIPEAITGEYPLKLKDLVYMIDKQREKEKKQRKIVQEKETDLKNTFVTTENLENIKSNIPTWREIFLYADIPTKRVLVNKLIEHIDITKEKIVIYFKNSFDDFLLSS